MTPAPQTHNRHLDATRALVAASAFPTPLNAHDLDCALRLAETARHCLAEAYRLVKPDHALAIRCETAGRDAKAMRDSVQARITGALQ